MCLCNNRSFFVGPTTKEGRKDEEKKKEDDMREKKKIIADHQTTSHQHQTDHHHHQALGMWYFIDDYTLTGINLYSNNEILLNLNWNAFFLRRIQWKDRDNKQDFVLPFPLSF